LGWGTANRVLRSELRARSAYDRNADHPHRREAISAARVGGLPSGRSRTAPALNRSCALSAPPAARTSCPLQSGIPGSLQSSPDDAERKWRYQTPLDPDPVLALSASAARRIGEMSVELISGLVSAPPALPKVRLCNLFKLLADEGLWPSLLAWWDKPRDQSRASEDWASKPHDVAVNDVASDRAAALTA
jgi:hypothetical protein